MRVFINKVRNRVMKGTSDGGTEDFEHLQRKVATLYALVAGIYGSDKVVLRAGKLKALQLMRSEHIEERVLALQRIVYGDPTYDIVPERGDLEEILEKIEDEISDGIARRAVEAELEKKVNERLQRRHEDYVREIKTQLIKEEVGPENAQTLKRLAVLEKLEQKHLGVSIAERLRPSTLVEIVGQERAVQAVLAKLATPFPQHLILYGPPGVGKTTAARLALEAAKSLPNGPFDRDAPFVEVDGATLRWDPREITNPLLGSVHDPIYQGARRDLAENGIPEPKLGLVTDAHGGVLFIDEIGEMDPLLQNKLLKVLEDKRVFFDSAYYDEHDRGIPQYVHRIFEKGAPADFILMGATTRSPEEISLAIRSRCAEVYFDPLTPLDIQLIVEQAGDRLGVVLEKEVPEIISEYTVDGRKAVGILADAYGLTCYRRRDDKEKVITADMAYEVIQMGRLSPYALNRASSEKEVGKVFGLGVSGFVGSVIEIEAVVFPARKEGEGQVRFNEAAGSMARDSVFNAASVIRRITGKNVGDYDVHVNVVGGGRIDGPSAGVAVFIALLSAIQGRPVPQDIGVTGELSVQGRVRMVGGIPEKIYGAKQAGIKKVLIPAENAHDVPSPLQGISVVPVRAVEEVLAEVFGGTVEVM